MAPSHIRLVGSIIVATLVGSACTAAPPATPELSPAASPSSPITPASASPTAAPTPATQSPSATPTPTSTPEHTIGSWVLETTLPEFRVGDLVAARGLVIAVGCKPASEFGECVHAKVEVSTAGKWAPAQLEDSNGEIFLAAAAADADGFVAVGVERGPGLDSFGNLTSTAASFVSTDGLIWRRAPDQESLHGTKMNDVVARPGGGWTAVGSRAGVSVYEGFETWSSADGLAWQLVGSMAGVDSAGVASYQGGLVAWGDGCTDACGAVPVLIWTSTDGREWDRVPDQPSLASADFGGVVGLSNGALAVGSQSRADGSGVGTTWLSKDAATWPPKALPDSREFDSFQLAMGAAGFVAVGRLATREDGPWSTWISEDGATWKRLPDAELAAGDSPRFLGGALAADGASFISAGRSATGSAVFRLWIR